MTLTRGQLVTAARERGYAARERDVQRAVSEERLEPAPAKIGDRFAYLPKHVDQFCAFLGTIRRRVPADDAKAAS